MLETAGHRVKTFPGAAEFLKAYDPAESGCLLLDVRMPGMDGLELQRSLARKGIEIPIIFLSAHGDIPMAVETVQKGAVHFLEKPADPAALREQVARALERDVRRRRDVAENAEVQAAYDSLTRREREILKLLVDGKSANTVASVLGIANSTVRVLRARLMKKMRADTVADLINMVGGLAKPPPADH
jgi:FixJ family two-component response regulator